MVAVLSTKRPIQTPYQEGTRERFDSSLIIDPVSIISSCDLIDLHFKGLADSQAGEIALEEGGKGGRRQA